jgi:hypothetical protein
MLATLMLWSVMVPQEDELLRVTIYPGAWAAAVTAFTGKATERNEVRGVGCVGLVSTDMFCGWEQRIKRNWQRRSGRADLSAENKPRMIEEALQ